MKLKVHLCDHECFHQYSVYQDLMNDGPKISLLLKRTARFANTVKYRCNLKFVNAFLVIILENIKMHYLDENMCCFFVFFNK